MAFASIFRRSLAGASSSPSSIVGNQFASTRLYGTLTSPKLFISGLSRLTTDEKLKEAFAPFGHLVEAKVIMDRASGRSKGFGFVTYDSIEDAEKAKAEMNAKFLDGWVIFVDPAKPREFGLRPPPPQQQHQQQYQQQNPAADPSGLGFRTNKTVGWCG